MIGWLLDTNVVAEIIGRRAEPRVRAWADAQDEADLHLSVLTFGEYEKGLAKLPLSSPRRLPINAHIASLRTRFSGRILSVSDNIVLRWGAISGLLKQMTNVYPPVVDAMLAATAIEHGLYLVTRNVKDVRHTGATVFNPWQDDPTRFPIIRRH